MRINCDRKFIRYISENWEDSKKGQEVQEMIEAIVSKLKTGEKTIATDKEVFYGKKCTRYDNLCCRNGV